MYCREIDDAFITFEISIRFLSRQSDVYFEQRIHFEINKWNVVKWINN